MTFFSEPSSEGDARVREQSEAFARAHEANRRRSEEGSRRARIGLVFLSVGMLLLVALGFSPAPYVVRSPGPVFDALGTVQASQDDPTQVEVITIGGADTFEPSEGQLDVMTVNVGGRPENLPNWFEVFLALVTPSNDVLPVEAYYADAETGEQRDAQNAALMQGSEADAIAAALINEGYDVGTALAVVSVGDDGAAAEMLEPGDIVTSVSGIPVESTDGLPAAVAEASGGDLSNLQPVDVVVDRGGEPQTFSITPRAGVVEGEERALLGVTVATQHEFPIDVSIELGNVGGPSAGLIFALAVSDKLADGDLTRGLHVAGTGTMSPDGTVGSIGGITQKLYAAVEVGADLFLAPADNCQDVLDGGIPGDIPVYAVSTLDEAEQVIQAVGDGGDTASLRTCESVLGS
ncbi:PDZ domain-containing protein [Pseudoclavibacter sp. AY1F1]|uniref:YlbL family protein n=1 Tax=Pseudoclavibacter sp. AY1F1 TaxID=2080583 RepID=UPI0011B08A3A|nr:S16 family serine protease [Pseudoclavibacter sp. AY1F1]